MAPANFVPNYRNWPKDKFGRMKRILIMAIQGLLSKRQMRSLEHIILQNYWTYVSPEKPQLVWNSLPLDAKPDGISIILIECDSSIGADIKLKLLKESRKAWQRVTANTEHRMIIEILASPIFNKYLLEMGLTTSINP